MLWKWFRLFHIPLFHCRHFIHDLVKSYYHQYSDRYQIRKSLFLNVKKGLKWCENVKHGMRSEIIYRGKLKGWKGGKLEGWKGERGKGKVLPHVSADLLLLAG